MDILILIFAQIARLWLKENAECSGKPVHPLPSPSQPSGYDTTVEVVGWTGFKYVVIRWIKAIHLDVHSYAFSATRKART